MSSNFIHFSHTRTFKLYDIGQKGSFEWGMSVGTAVRSTVEQFWIIKLNTMHKIMHFQSST